MEPIDEAKINLRLGKEAIARGEFAAALELFQCATDSGLVISEAIYGWGVAALQLGRKREALNALHRALDAEPPHPEAALKLAELALVDREEAAALELYGRAIEIAPNYAGAYLGSGKVAARLGFEAEALESCSRAFEVNPEYPEAGLRLAEWTLANGSAAEALEIYRRVLKIAPELAEAEYGCGVAALEIGYIEQARESFSRALKLNPGYAAAITAAAFLAIFPADRNLKPAKPQRQLICVPVSPYFRDWLGGQIYLLNFARIMATLPKSERPRLVVVVMDDWQKSPGLGELVAALFRCDSVIGIFDHAGQPLSLKPLLSHYLRTRQGIDRDQSRQRKFF